VSEREQRAVEGPVQGHGAGHETASVSEPGVRIHPPAGPRPPRGAPPTARWIRWVSPHERQGYRPAVDVFVGREAYARVCEHAESDLEREVGGGLAGQVYLDETGQRSFVVVEAAIPGRHTRQGNAFITFTQETLLALHEDVEALRPEARLVGWYHTHPRMGVFLSGYDRWLHHHFFPEPWQVALVIEPHTQMGGFFIRGETGEIPSREYAGFFEVLEADQPSSARWTNLEREPEAGRAGMNDEVNHE
jgi:proteasome lid subunit RPN8/RPN11